MVPLIEEIPPLQVITLGLVAFGFGLEIGSTANTRWLHFAGVGLDTTALAPQGWTPSAKWIETSNMHSTNSALPSGIGWILTFTDGAEFDRYFDCSENGMPACPSPPAASEYEADFWMGHSHVTAGTEVVVGSRAPGDPFYMRYITAEQMRTTGLQIDQPLQPYTGQAVDGTTGWKVSGGCGDTTPACSYPGTEPDPVFSAPHLRCQLSGAAIDCGSGSPLACILSDGSGLYGGAGSTGCGLGPGAEGQLNCIADPLDYYCPTTNGPGTNFSSTGGAAGPMPDCYGFSVSECEGAITVVRPDATFTLVTEPSPDPSVADGHVISTTPTATTAPVPNAVTIATNPANSDPEHCAWSIGNPHPSNNMTTLGWINAKGRALCNYSTTLSAYVILWKCDSEPSENLDMLEGGSWGCVFAADGSYFEVPVTAGRTQYFRAPSSPSVHVTGDNKYFIAYGTLDKGDPPTGFSNIEQLP